MSRSWSRTLPGYFLSTYATLSRGVCQMGGPVAVSATCRPLLAFHDTALKIAVAMSAFAKGTSSAGASDHAGRPARRLGAGHQRDLRASRRH